MNVLGAFQFDQANVKKGPVGGGDILLSSGWKIKRAWASKQFFFFVSPKSHPIDYS